MTKAVQDLMVAVMGVRDAFVTALYTTPDADRALAFATEDCTVVNLPTGTGATDADGLRRYLVEDVYPHLPADLIFRRLSRTGDRWRVAQEDMVSFTHDRELPWLLPRVAPTHRRAEVLAVSMVTVSRSRVVSLRTLWDQVSLAAQLGLDPRAQP